MREQPLSTNERILREAAEDVAKKKHQRNSLLIEITEGIKNNKFSPEEVEYLENLIKLDHYYPRLVKDWLKAKGKGMSINDFYSHVSERAHEGKFTTDAEIKEEEKREETEKIKKEKEESLSNKKSEEFMKKLAGKTPAEFANAYIKEFDESPHHFPPPDINQIEEKIFKLLGEAFALKIYQELNKLAPEVKGRRGGAIERFKWEILSSMSRKIKTLPTQKQIKLAEFLEKEE